MPVEAICTTCQKAFRLKDEFAGKKVRCPECQEVIQVPLLEDYSPNGQFDESIDPAFQHDRYFLAQKVLSLVESYKMTDEQGQPIFFIRRKVHYLKSLASLFGGAFAAVAFIVFSIVLSTQIPKEVAAVVGVLGMVLGVFVGIVVAVSLSPKRHIEYFADMNKKHLLLEVKQDTKWQLWLATFTVSDPSQGIVGSFTKHNIMNLIRKRWFGYDPDGELILIAREDSVILSLLRRVLGPMFGLLRTNFIIVRPKNEAGKEEIIGEFNRKFTLFDKYVLDLTADRRRTLDRRMAVALAVLLDTAEQR